MGAPGSELYYFPKSSVGSGREWSVTETSVRQQEQSATELADHAASIGTFLAINNGESSGSGDAPGSGDASMFTLMLNPSAAGTAGSSGTSMANLKEKRTRLMSSVGLAEKINAKIDGHPGLLPDRVAAAGATLLLLTEQSEILASELNFVIKYSKDTAGKAATPSLVENLCKKADSLSSKMLEEVKVIRALTATSPVKA